MADTPLDPGRRARLLLILLCLLLAAGNVALWFPGIMTHDSFRQYGEAVSGHYTPWHPPIMAWLWSCLLPVSRGGSALLVLHVLLYWMTFYLVADALLATGRLKAMAAILAVGLAPPFIILTAFIWKDVGMAVTLLAAFAILFRCRVLARIGTIAAVAVGLLLAYGVLVRSNAIFAAAPLILYAWRPHWIARPMLLLVASAAMVVIAIPASTVVNSYVLRAEGRAAFKSLILYDIVGTAHFSRDPSKFTVPVDMELVDHCYSPKWWDPINFGRCAQPILMGTKGVKPWILSVASHPVAYAEHRVAHFNEALFGFVGPETFRYEDTVLTRRYRAMPQAPLMLKGTALHAQLQSFPLFSPALFLLIALEIMGLIWRYRQDRSLLAQGSFYLAASSALYSFSFLIVGVANMYRYQFYPLAAAAVALVLFVSDRVDRGSRPDLVEWACIVATILFAIGIGLSRITL
ncbi:MAG TPA: hypothetical protein VF649_01855 [Sphingomonas sp.]|uniref:hypothetical protein n=1 Tax=Sphingomonas sp. TaxID=28214 RepID=UPI002ED9F0EE